MLTYKPGTILRFTYLGKNTQDKFKEVFVLNPNWQNNMHAIDLKRLNMAERVVLKMIMDPKNKNVQHKIALVNDIFRRMDPINDIRNPYSFYHKFVKSFIRNKDVYRKYRGVKVSAAQVVTTIRTFDFTSGTSKPTKTTPTNPKPLFGPK